MPDSPLPSPRRLPVGGVIHTYQKYDPVRFPTTNQPPVDVASAAMEHLLFYGDQRPLTEEELARAIRLDPSQIQGLGPSIDALLAMLEERRRKILATYETDSVRNEARRAFEKSVQSVQPPREAKQQFLQAAGDRQLADLERLWYRWETAAPQAARQLLRTIERLGDHYQVEELVSRYEFTGRTKLTVPQALEIKEELARIEELLKQLQDARQSAQIGIVDLEALSEFAQPEDLEHLSALAQRIQDVVREAARQQGLESRDGQFHLTPSALRVFQNKLLERLFSELQASRSGRHTGPVTGEGAVEMQATKPYEFGDSVAQMDICQSMINAMVRTDCRLPLRLESRDIEIHQTRNRPKSATVVVMDMSGSMRYEGQYVNVKRMGLALDGLIRREYPGDYLTFVEMASFARHCPTADVPRLLPKPVTIYDPVVRLKADMSRPDIAEADIPPHFTNIQHALQLSRQILVRRNTPNRQIILITDGLPTAHFEQQMLYLLYPPHRQTELATMREGKLCQRDGIVINLFLIPSWSQSQEDVQFAQRLAASTMGRVFFTAGRDLDRYVLWDYVRHKREIIG
ncbi:MAG: hypothetical protein O2931_10580 [Planctomycetota bacterium]|nr:hypothetical protein [Planctomycetota bacterium]MDA1179228.1 hypothetical protein [Planctomycetota bacterium]